MDTHFDSLNSYSKNILLKLVTCKRNKGSLDLKLGKFDFDTNLLVLWLISIRSLIVKGVSQWGNLIMLIWLSTYYKQETSSNHMGNAISGDANIILFTSPDAKIFHTTFYVSFVVSYVIGFRTMSILGFLILHPFSQTTIFYCNLQFNWMISPKINVMFHLVVLVHFCPSHLHTLFCIKCHFRACLIKDSAYSTFC